MSTRDTLSAAGSFLKDQGLQVKTENDLVELIEANLTKLTEDPYSFIGDDQRLIDDDQQVDQDAIDAERASMVDALRGLLESCDQPPLEKEKARAAALAQLRRICLPKGWQWAARCAQSHQRQI
ncbi:unnamed protein product [Durusdinium trenchii]|uniref:Uncharacterized protein n=1 Tax=Durusdinium trenchii TaxID=1381693 RepID=A0ABP0IZN4_9DINO